MGSLEVPADLDSQVVRATNGAIGSALGTGAGVLVALLFMLAVFALNRQIIGRRMKKDRHGEDSYGEIFRTIILVVTPFILSTAVYNLSGTVNNTVYTKLLPEIRKLDTVGIYTRWGVFSGQALTISNIPIAFASAMAAAVLPSVAQMVASDNLKEARRKTGVAVKTTMILSIPCAVGLFVLARPVTGLLFRNTPEAEDLATRLLMSLSLSVVFFALSTLNSSILQGIGKVNRPIINAGIALAVQTVTAVVLLFFTDLDLYAIAIANTLYAGVMCLLNQIAVHKALEYRQEVVKTFLVPLLASVFMGAFAWAVYEGLLLLTASPRISVVIAICLAVCVYFGMLLLLRGVSEEELRGFPKGYLLVKVAKRCGLMKA